MFVVSEVMASPHENQLSTSADELVASDKQDVNGYDEFMSWRKSWNINSFSEEVVMEFFREAAETLTPEALHTLFSTLRAGMLSNHNVNIANFVFLRGGVAVPVSNGSSKGFSDEEINKFLTEAPDAEYLATKVWLLYETIVCINAKLCFIAGCDCDRITCRLSIRRLKKYRSEHGERSWY